MAIALDIIGDIHGELRALEALGRELGYRVDGDWSSPQGRMLVFLGDLVDRGAHSLEVAELVHRLTAVRRAFCIMGNHEYNLVAWKARIPGYEEPKPSNRATTTDIEKRRERWEPVLDWMRRLPLALALPDLRIIHACWHRASLDAVQPWLGTVGRAATPGDAFAWLEQHVVLRSPFNFESSLAQTRLLADLPGDTADFDADIPHENLIKGYEAAAPEPFLDNDGKLRTRMRATWWKPAWRGDVLTDRTQVFGHYWNLPPIDGEMAPPHPSGHPELRAWAKELVGRVITSQTPNRQPLLGDIACIDFQGVTNASEHACIGALRWPESEIVWATAQKTAGAGRAD